MQSNQLTEYFTISKSRTILCCSETAIDEIEGSKVVCEVFGRDGIKQIRTQIGFMLPVLLKKYMQQTKTKTFTFKQCWSFSLCLFFIGRQNVSTFLWKDFLLSAKKRFLALNPDGRFFFPYSPIVKRS